MYPLSKVSEGSVNHTNAFSAASVWISKKRGNTIILAKPNTDVGIFAIFEPASLRNDKNIDLLEVGVNKKQSS